MPLMTCKCRFPSLPPSGDQGYNDGRPGISGVIKYDGSDQRPPQVRSKTHQDCLPDGHDDRGEWT